MASGFPLFSTLPLEIRRMIWQASLPNDDAVVFPHNHLWHAVYEQTESQEERDQEIMVQLPSPKALWVCRESRAEAKRWLSSLGGQMWPKPRPRPTACVRPWRPGKDVLYMGGTRDLEVLYRSERAGRAVRHLAVPVWPAYHDVEKLAMALECLPGIRYVYLVWGSLPSPMACKPRSKWLGPIPRWTLVGAEGQVGVCMCSSETEETSGWMEDVLEGMEAFEDQMEGMFEMGGEREGLKDEDGNLTVKFVPVKIDKETTGW